MIHLLTGPRGTGKTQKMIELANEKVKSSSGDIVLIKRSHKETYTVDFHIRAICMSDYKDIMTIEELLGFLYGMVAGNHDIEVIFIDSLLKLAGMTVEGLPVFLEKLDRFSSEQRVDFYVSASVDKKDIPGYESFPYDFINQ